MLPLLALLALIAACTSFSETSPTDAGAVPQDGGSVDGALPPSNDAATEGDSNNAMPDGDAGLNLLDNGDFDLGCSGWTPGNANFYPEGQNHHSGLGSCRVCGKPDAGGFNIAATVHTPAGEGTTFRADFWWRKAEDAAAPAAPGFTLIVADTTSNVNDVKGFPAPLTAEWRQESLLINGADGGTRVRFFIGGDPPGAGTCIVVDDVSVRRTK